jgi:REP element-mobilizing transposase RayT
MKYNPDIHHRKSIRLKNYDYSKEGLYFITICTQNKENLFGQIIDGKMILNNAGEMIENNYYELFNYFDNINLNEYVIMPNHIHFIIEIVGVPLVGTQIQNKNNGTIPVGVPLVGTQSTIGDMIGVFKSLSTNEYIKMVKNNKLPNFDKRIWQKNYYENIIRNDKIHQKIIEYIKTNPLKWKNDKYYM